MQAVAQSTDRADQPFQLDPGQAGFANYAGGDFGSLGFQRAAGIGQMNEHFAFIAFTATALDVALPFAGQRDQAVPPPFEI